VLKLKRVQHGEYKLSNLKPAEIKEEKLSEKILNLVNKN
jgi:16S rRNA U516 pseudouridylate synthase RsuA-like enzyme